jgi:hypothetical protein
MPATKRVALRGRDDELPDYFAMRAIESAASVASRDPAGPAAHALSNCFASDASIRSSTSHARTCRNFSIVNASADLRTWSIQRLVKRLSGDQVRSRNSVAMANEVPAKLICYNLPCVILVQCELEIEPVFWNEGKPAAMLTV